MQEERTAELRIWQRHPNLAFWLCFVVLNLLLFLPLYLLNQDETTLFPDLAVFSRGTNAGLTSLFLWRYNLDPLRLSLELTLLAALWVVVRRLQRSLVRFLFVALYLLALGYYIYEAVVVSIYLADPVFYSQFFLALDGLPFLASHLQASPWLYVAGASVLFVAAAGIVGLVNILLTSGASPGLHRITRVAIVLLAGLGLLSAAFYRVDSATPELVVSSLALKLEKNIAGSLRLRNDIASFDDGTVRRTYNYAQYRLQRKPDIYFLFVESYGSVLYKRPDYRAAYTRLMSDLEARLQDDGWRAATALSDSPTWGGGSWLAYTSTLFGLRIDSHPQYLSLFRRYQVDDYPDLGRTLQAQGYEYAWVSSIEDHLSDRSWAGYYRFLGVDRLLRYRDMGYGGEHYGWGPAPPDQYVLHYGDEVLQQGTDKPLFFCMITQNSHYPFAPLPHLVEDWRTLDEPRAEPAGDETVDPEQVAHATMRRNYMDAIDYELRALTEFVLSKSADDAVFVIMGDHQPPGVARRSDGWATPVHVISKDPALVDFFADYGFNPGLTVSDTEPSLRHEGIYSLFMRALLERYGARSLALPSYLPRGVTPNAPVEQALN
jgi:hypothetical protein